MRCWLIYSAAEGGTLRNSAAEAKAVSICMRHDDVVLTDLGLRDVVRRGGARSRQRGTHENKRREGAAPKKRLAQDQITDGAFTELDEDGARMQDGS